MAGSSLKDPQNLALTEITRELASRVPALAVYLVGSRATQSASLAADYDLIVVLRTIAVPIYLRRLKSIGAMLSEHSGSKVEMNPLPAFRLRRSRGSLFLMKAKEQAILLYGKKVLEDVDTGGLQEIPADGYFSFFSFLLKDVLERWGTEDTATLAAMARKIAEGLTWLSRHSRNELVVPTRTYAMEFSKIAAYTRISWHDITKRMIMLFRELAGILLGIGSSDLQTLADVFMRTNAGKNVLKNLEYGVMLLLMRGELVSLKRLFSRTLIQNRYRAGLILLSGAALTQTCSPRLTARAYSILEGCLKVSPSTARTESWERLRQAVLDYWSFAQPVMGV